MYIQIELELSRVCNLKCLHCFSESGGIHEKDKPSLDEIDRLISKLKEFKDYVSSESFATYSFIISGGEPTFLGSDVILRIAEKLKESFGENCRISLNTNLTNRKVFEKLMEENMITLAVSFDPVIRSLKCSFDFERKWLENFMALDIAGKEIPVELTLTRYLIEFPLEEFVSRLRLKEIGLSPVLPMGRAKKYFDVIGLTPWEVSDCAIYALKTLGRKIHISSYQGLKEFAEVRKVYNIPYRVECWGDCWNRFIIKRDGTVEIGDRCFNYPVCGNIYKDTIHDIFNSPARTLFMGFQLEKSSSFPCITCQFNYFCMGGCTIWYFWKGGSYLDKECPGYKRVLEYVIEGKDYETQEYFVPKSDFMKEYSDRFFNTLEEVSYRC